MRRFFFSLFVLSVVLQSLPVYAQPGPVPGFTYDNILSDEEMTDYTSMSQVEIQKFLESKGSYLANYVVTLATGERYLASEHIYRVSQTNQISPQFLLVLIQKEQSLVEETTPKTTQLDWAAGYGCFDGRPCNERWRGFDKQLNSAAIQFRYYIDHIDEYNYQPGKTVSIDGLSVTIKNRATAALYNYTPHLHGNYLVKTLWKRYFIQGVPDGTLVQVKGNPSVWLLQNGTKRLFKNWLSLVSRYNPKLIVNIKQTDLDQYPGGMDIEFPAYSLLKSKETGKMYLLTTQEKRLISSMEVFRKLGFNPEEVDVVNEEQLTIIPDGSDLTMDDSYPTGAILQDRTTGELYYAEAGRKYAILDKTLLAVNYPGKPVTKVKTDVLESLLTGMPVQLKDGVLVKGSAPEVYVISNGQKRHIGTEDVFNRIGYKWSNIIAVSDDVLIFHPTGEPVALN